MIRVCKKGNSCGKSCISQKKICRKNLPPKTQDPLEEKAKAKAKAKPLEPKAKAKAKVKTPTPISPDTYSKNLIEKIEEITGEEVLVKRFAKLDREMGIRNADTQSYKDWEKENKSERLKENPDYLEIKWNIIERELYRANERNSASDIKFWESEQEKTQKLINELKDTNSESYYARKARELNLEDLLPGGSTMSPQEFDTLRKLSTEKIKENIYYEVSRQLQHLVYEKKGLNAKPEKGELDGRDDLLTDRSGANLILHRGVKVRKAVDDFFEGDRHYVGEGMFGNGTYFAGDYSSPKTTNKEIVERTATEYGENVYKAGIKKDAVVFTGGVRELEILERFLRMRYGRDRDTDFGALMAAAGFDAYLGKQANHPTYPGQQNGIDFIVVLNRGKLVVTEE